MQFEIVLIYGPYSIIHCTLLEELWFYIVHVTLGGLKLNVDGPGSIVLRYFL